MNIKSAFRKFVFGEDEPLENSQSGYIKAVTPDRKVEVVVRFDDNEEFGSMKSDIMSLITHSFSNDK